jgi:uncharacterized cupin superfamily protein
LQVCLGSKHIHRYGEFAYLLKESVTVVAEEKRPAMVTVGQRFFEPAGEWGTVSTAPEGVRSVVFCLLEAGQHAVFLLD